jgi:dolichyl-phosphate-mannose-protein mannosyltransferase
MQVVNREQRVEYRDEKGNILNEAQVKELKGKAKFEVHPPLRCFPTLDVANMIYRQSMKPGLES